MLFQIFRLATVLSILTLCPAVAQTAADLDLQVDSATEAAAAPFEVMEVSARLARLGTQRADPWLLATAARLRLSSPPPVRTARGAGADRADPEVSATLVDPSGPAPWPRIAEAWLDDAERLADGDAEILAFIADVRALDYKGRNGGPLVSLARLAPGQTHVFRERFSPGRPAVVYVEGDGDAPLAVTVKTEAALVCQAAGPGDVKLCTWTAREPGNYQVEVRNLGAATNRYAYGTN